MKGDVIFVRDACGTSIARCLGRTASCTAGRRAAAEAVARKVMGDRPHQVVRCGSDYAWRIVERGAAVQVNHGK